MIKIKLDDILHDSVYITQHYTLKVFVFSTYVGLVNINKLYLNKRPLEYVHLF